MFRAAFTSRSRVAPQPHIQRRTFSGIVSRTLPQTEHSLEEGNQRSTAITSRPYHLALYSSRLRNSDHAASDIARARLPLRSIPETFKSSITIVWFSRTSRVVIW